MGWFLVSKAHILGRAMLARPGNALVTSVLIAHHPAAAKVTAADDCAAKEPTWVGTIVVIAVSNALGLVDLLLILENLLLLGNYLCLLLSNNFLLHGQLLVLISLHLHGGIHW